MAPSERKVHDLDSQVVLLPHELRGYARYIVVLDPQDANPYSIGIRHVLPSSGAKRILQSLIDNVKRSHKKPVQAWLCRSIMQGTCCPYGNACHDIHVTPEGFQTRRPWNRAIRASRTVHSHNHHPLHVTRSPMYCQETRIDASSRSPACCLTGNCQFVPLSPITSPCARQDMAQGYGTPATYIESPEAYTPRMCEPVCGYEECYYWGPRCTCQQTSYSPAKACVPETPFQHSPYTLPEPRLGPEPPVFPQPSVSVGPRSRVRRPLLRDFECRDAIADVADYSATNCWAHGNSPDEMGSHCDAMAAGPQMPFVH
eukprot:GGOE01003869.1.p1 GENE.GGOE01003869.1~~GGOE01003869.1.p1  ORF type:complete len:314 (-),score=-9.65 GGOE01003869.1:909-1850(-)